MFSPFLTVLMDEQNLINVATLKTHLSSSILFKWKESNLLLPVVWKKQK